ncbi:MAG: signal peptidase II, partial [Nitrosomonadales bacterium]
MKLHVSLILALALLIFDFATKRWVESELIYGQQILFTDFFNLVLT